MKYQTDIPELDTPLTLNEAKRLCKHWMENRYEDMQNITINYYGGPNDHGKNYVATFGCYQSGADERYNVPEFLKINPATA